MLRRSSAEASTTGCDEHWLPRSSPYTRTGPLQVVHSDDAHRLFVRAAVDPEVGSGAVNLAAPGELNLE